MFKEFHTIDPIENDFYDILHEDAYVINNRVRRFTNGGSILQSLKIEQLKPFLSNKIIEHIYALPDEYRIKSKLYRYALLREHSDLFKAIPWQKTGKTIDKELNIIDFILNGFKNRLIKNGIIADNKNFVDYKNWMKCQNIAAFFANILDKSGAIYPNFCNRDLKNEFLIPYLNNEANYYEKVGRAVTIEIWLQQTFNNSFLTLPSNVPNFS
jgi:asparagine synthase (glutamine-hydrolysing)